jgi:two-component system LytT family sensor kinase
MKASLPAVSAESSLPDTRPPARWLLGLGVWAVIVLAFASQTYGTYAVKREPIAFSQALLWAVNSWTGWLVLAPVVFWIARRIPIERPQLGGTLGLHALAGAGIAIVAGLLCYSMEVATGQAMSETLSTRQLALMYVSKNWAFYTLIYAALVALYHGVDYYGRYRERMVREAQLTAQLSGARLDVLKMQLQPHFLFNTLHAISALVRKDPEAADRIITRLGDILRMTLQTNGRQEVPLQQELELLEKYFEIQRTRFGSRLKVHLQQDATATDALVPSLLLQPLIENSVRHAVEAREEPGSVWIETRRTGDRLRLEVRDDGPGFPDDVKTPAPGRGLGLRNTRARLSALYGDSASFDLGDGAEGGARVTIDIPYRAGPRAGS